MLATLKNHRLVRPALLLAFVLTLTGVAGLSKPARAFTQSCIDDCNAELTECEAACPLHAGRLPCLAACRSYNNACISGC